MDDDLLLRNQGRQLSLTAVLLTKISLLLKKKNDNVESTIYSYRLQNFELKYLHPWLMYRFL